MYLVKLKAEAEGGDGDGDGDDSANATNVVNLTNQQLFRTNQ